MGLSGPSKKKLGEQSQAHIMARLLEVGYTVLVPYGDSSRYDLVVDYFAVYSHELKKVYLVPAEHVANRTRMNLRLAPSKNNQKRGVHFAADYEV